MKHVTTISLFLLFPAVLLASEPVASEPQSCNIKMRTLVLAFHKYADTNNELRFPPPFTVNVDNKPLHSWRVLILPFIGQEELYKAIRLEEPWNSEHNKQFHDKMPEAFRCPASTLGNPNRDTTYCMVVGKDVIGVPDGKGTTVPQITDGTSHTILLVERKTPVCWMEPTDVLQEHAYLGINKHKFGIGSEHAWGIVATLADGSNHFLKEGIGLNMLKSLLTKAGVETVNRDELLVFLEFVQ